METLGNHAGAEPAILARGVWKSLTGPPVLRDVSLTVRSGETLALLGNVAGGVDTRVRDELVERLQLDPDIRVRAYSKGNRQKVMLVAAFMTHADVLLLDEPTAGLDPLMEAEFQAMVREATGRGQTVFLSSHLLDEVEDVCGRVRRLERDALEPRLHDREPRALRRVVERERHERGGLLRVVHRCVHGRRVPAPGEKPLRLHSLHRRLEDEVLVPGVGDAPACHGPGREAGRRDLTREAARDRPRRGRPRRTCRNPHRPGTTRRCPSPSA